MKKIELLSPAGSLPNLKAAICSGADAVYLGMNRFNARENAINFNEEYLPEAVKLAKSNGVKVYLTMNTLVKNEELREFLLQLEYAYYNGIDAVIVQDPSLIDIVKSSFPGLRVHVSTQAGVMNSNHANLFSEADRINLARELSKESIKSLRDRFSKEIEIFCHGALCVCVSGSCLFSSLLGGSGNRGKCAQPCRKPYNSSDSYLLSTKELCLLDRIPEIIGLGVDSIKIEGRMRTPYYVATATSVYRRAIDMFYDGKFEVTNTMRSELESAFSREFTEGKFSGSLVSNSRAASGTSDVKEKFYEAEMKDIELQKRDSKLVVPEFKDRQSSGKRLIARVYNLEDALVANKYANIICIDAFHENFMEIRDKTQRPVYAVTPRIMFDSDLETVEKRIREINPDGLIAGNLGILKMNLDMPIILDYNANAFNDLQLEYFRTLNCKAIISPELSLEELTQFKSKDFIVFAHGRIRLMTLAHDMPIGKLRDEKGFDFHVRKIFNGTEIINDKELGLFNKVSNLMKEGINQIYVDTSDNVEPVLSAYRQILDKKAPNVSDLQRNYILGWSKLGVA